MQEQCSLHKKRILQGNVKVVCKLDVLPPLHFLHGLPKSFPVSVFQGSLRRQQDFGTDYAAFMGVIDVLTVVFTVELFAGTVGGCGNGGLSGAAFDLSNMEMIQCDGQALPWSREQIASASKA